MRVLLTHVDLKIILLVPVFVGYLIFRLLGFHIGPKSWTHWFWGESGDKNRTPTASK